MSAYMNWIEFTGRDGSKITQRAEDICTIIETEVPVKAAEGGGKRKETYLLLANNNRISVVGVTRGEIFERIRQSTGTIISIIEEQA